MKQRMAGGIQKPFILGENKSFFVRNHSDSNKKLPYRYLVCLVSTDSKLARSFSLKFRYIDDVPSLNNARFVDYVDLIYST
jgi:hypothetical protein